MIIIASVCAAIGILLRKYDLSGNEIPDLYESKIDVVVDQEVIELTKVEEFIFTDIDIDELFGETEDFISEDMNRALELFLIDLEN